MNRLPFQATLHAGLQSLCLVLCPLLLCAQETMPVASTRLAEPAQQTLEQSASVATPETVPEKLLIPLNRVVSLFFLEPVSSATATAGTPVRFALAQDLKMGGVILLSRGTVVKGKVAEVQRGIAGKRRARLAFQVEPISLGAGVSLPLQSVLKTPHGQKASRAALWVLAAPLVVLAAPALLAMSIDDGHESKKPTGEDIFFSTCDMLVLYVAADTMVTVATLTPTAGEHISFRQTCSMKWKRICTNDSRRNAVDQLCKADIPAASPDPSLVPASEPPVALTPP